MKLWLEPFYDLVNETPKDTEVIVSKLGFWLENKQITELIIMIDKSLNCLLLLINCVGFGVTICRRARASRK